jgi:hypothetical protein
MNSKPFVQGFNDVRQKLPFQYDGHATNVEAFSYELGRQFALNYIGNLKQGRRVCIAAEMVMNDLMRSGIIK